MSQLPQRRSLKEVIMLKPANTLRLAKGTPRVYLGTLTFCAEKARITTTACDQAE
jgi:hypothetical protein